MKCRLFPIFSRHVSFFYRNISAYSLRDVSFFFLQVISKNVHQWIQGAEKVNPAEKKVKLDTENY